MRRTNIYLTLKQWAWLAKEARASGLSVAEIVRRFIDEGIGRVKQERKK